MSPIPKRPDLLAVWSEPQVNSSSSPQQAKLGGTGLGLVELLSIEKIAPGETAVADLRKPGRFLCYMQKANGSFYTQYIPAEQEQLHRRISARVSHGMHFLRCASTTDSTPSMP